MGTKFQLDVTEHRSGMVRLFNAFGTRSDGKEEMILEYWRVFDYLNPGEWRMVVDNAIRTMSSFPKIADLRKLVNDMGLREWKKDESDYSPWITVDCRCGASFAVGKRDVLQPSIAFICPVCKAGYSSQLISDMERQDHADFAQRQLHTDRTGNGEVNSKVA